MRAIDPANFVFDDEVRQLQLRLWAAAKRSSGRRFHALYDRLGRRDVLLVAWERVRRNRGAAGVDGVALAEIERVGVGSFLEGIRSLLVAGSYRPQVVLRRYVPKSDGRGRPLGIPSVRDRVVQMALRLVLGPVFEADFRSCSFGFRPKRSAVQALEALRGFGARGGNFVLDVDIGDYFGSIDQGALLRLVGRRVCDRRMLKLVRQWLEAGVLVEGVVESSVRGTPQGGVISPLLANVFLHELDRVWEESCSHLGLLVRYADDRAPRWREAVMCRSQGAVLEATRRLLAVLGDLGLELNPVKSRVVDFREGREGFGFLGCHLRKRMSGRIWEWEQRRVYFLHRWPSAASLLRVRQRVRELIGRGWQGVRDVRVLIAMLNPVLRGWGAYFRLGNAARKFNQLDGFVWRRLVRFMVRRKGRHLRPGEVRGWTAEFFHRLGLHRLRGSVRYPGVVHASV